MIGVQPAEFLLLYCIRFFIAMQQKQAAPGNKATLIIPEKIVRYCYLDGRKILGLAPDTFLNKRLK